MQSKSEMGTKRPIGRVSREFANGPGYGGSIPGRVIPKTQKMVLDTSLFNTQLYKVGIKVGIKVELSMEWNINLHHPLMK